MGHQDLGDKTIGRFFRIPDSHGQHTTLCLAGSVIQPTLGKATIGMNRSNFRSVLFFRSTRPEMAKNVSYESKKMMH
jgi:hypothetical protein